MCGNEEVGLANYGIINALTVRQEQLSLFVTIPVWMVLYNQNTHPHSQETAILSVFIGNILYNNIVSSILDNLA